MKVETEKETLCMQRMVGQKTEVVMLDGDAIVPDIKPDIISTINTSGNVCIYKKEVLEGKVRIDGSIDVNIIYLSDTEDGSVRGLNTSLDFTQIFDLGNAKVDMDLDVDVTLKDIECKVLNGRKVSIKASTQFAMKVYHNEEVQMVKQIDGMDDLQKLNKTLCMNSLVGKGTTKAYAKETMAIDNIDNLAEVLKTNIELVNKDIKISYNKVLAKAEARVKVMYITEDNRINLIEECIPVMGFIDIQNITEEQICDVQYSLKNLIVKPNEVEQHSIYIEAEVELSCRVYETRQVEIIQDVYSPEYEIQFTQKKVNTMVGMQKVKDVCNIRENMPMTEIAGNKIYDVDIRPNISNMELLNDRIMYEGELEVRVLYASNTTTGMDCKVMNITFDFSMPANNLSNTCDIQTQMDTKDQSFVLMPDGNMDIQLDLEFSAAISKNVELNIIDEMQLEESRQNGLYSVIIYFVKPGDTLWNIAKRFKSTVDTIARVNGIEDENRITPGQQLFIPRYVPIKRNISA